MACLGARHNVAERDIVSWRAAEYRGAIRDVAERGGVLRPDMPQNMLAIFGGMCYGKKA